MLFSQYLIAGRTHSTQPGTEDEHNITLPVKQRSTEFHCVCPVASSTAGITAANSAHLSRNTAQREHAALIELRAVLGRRQIAWRASGSPSKPEEEERPDSLPLFLSHGAAGRRSEQAGTPVVSWSGSKRDRDIWRRFRTWRHTRQPACQKNIGSLSLGLRFLLF